MEEKSFRKTLWEKVKLLKMSNFTFFHNVFYAICILKCFNNHISIFVCSFFEFWPVSKWCIREWVKDMLAYQEVKKKISMMLTLYQTMPCFHYRKKNNSFENILGKGEIRMTSNFSFYLIFNSPEQNVLEGSFCDRPMSVVHCASFVVRRQHLPCGRSRGHISCSISVKFSLFVLMKARMRSNLDYIGS